MTAHVQKLTHEQARQVWRLYHNQKWTMERLAKQFAIAPSTVHGITHRRLYKEAWNDEGEQS